MDELRNGGAYVVDLDRQRYEVKAQGDFLIKVRQGFGWVSNAVECKYDEMSEMTGNVCVDLDSISKTWAPIWIYGLPNGGRIDVYTMQIKDLAPFARQYPIKKRVGEFSGECALIEKSVFTSQPFIRKWKTIQVMSANNEVIIRRLSSGKYDIREVDVDSATDYGIEEGTNTKIAQDVDGLEAAVGIANKYREFSASMRD